MAKTEERFQILADEWAEEGGIRVRISYDKQTRLKIISLYSIDGENIASASVARFRLERIIAALQEQGK